MCRSRSLWRGERQVHRRGRDGRCPGEEKPGGDDAISPARARIVARGARELRDGMYVNLGIGLPTAVPSYRDRATRVLLHSENGILGVGPIPAPGEADPDLINAGQGAGHGRDRRLDLRFRALVRYGARRPPGPGPAGRHAGVGPRRPGQLDGLREAHQGHGRRNGHRLRRQAPRGPGPQAGTERAPTALQQLVDGDRQRAYAPAGGVVHGVGDGGGHADDADLAEALDPDRVGPVWLPDEDHVEVGYVRADRD